MRGEHGVLFVVGEAAEPGPDEAGVDPQFVGHLGDVGGPADGLGEAVGVDEVAGRPLLDGVLLDAVRAGGADGAALEVADLVGEGGSLFAAGEPAVEPDDGAVDVDASEQVAGQLGLVDARLRVVDAEMAPR